MSYSAPVTPLRPVRHAICTVDRTQLVQFAYAAGATSGAWPTANLAIYVPVIVDASIVVRKLAMHNGSTASGNFDIGVYSAAGALLVSSGSTAQSGTATEQVVDVTDTTLAPGLYYIAACMDNTTGTTYRLQPTAPGPAAIGVLTEAVGAVTLPASATWVVGQTLGFIPALSIFVEATAE